MGTTAHWLGTGVRGGKGLNVPWVRGWHGAWHATFSPPPRNFLNPLTRVHFRETTTRLLQAMSIQAFGPRGSTRAFQISDTPTASGGGQVSSDPAGCYTYQFVNGGTKTAFMAFGRTRGVTAAVPPAGGAAANGVPILANEIVIYHCTPDAWFSFICASGESTTVYVTAGEGL